MTRPPRTPSLQFVARHAGEAIANIACTVQLLKLKIQKPGPAYLHRMREGAATIAWAARTRRRAGELAPPLVNPRRFEHMDRRYCQFKESVQKSAPNVPASVTVPARSSNATFTVTTRAVATSTAVTISASSGGITRTATLTVSPTPAADTVAIQRAEYAIGSRVLRVEATSASATLTVHVASTDQVIGTLQNDGGGRYRGDLS